ncbi:flavin monoamine oxidase family protein [Roseovarius sp. 2305UL8-3]|uniref:flavin monoamine oxidase family protein n=1 Tax=Roseovarius conchicola TaxID=3121636 RepID=UPI0035280D0A
MKTGIAIIGGGLSGLALASHLERAGQDYHLFEARDRLGGRIKTFSHGGTAFDLGPSWFWPGQPRMAALARDLGLEVFDQHFEGELAFEEADGQVSHGRGMSSMQGSWRLKGGMSGLIHGLALALPENRIHQGHAVRLVSRDQTVHFADGKTCDADQIVLALPPRVAAGMLPEGDALRPAMEAIPTWMGGHAKFVAVYEHPFWREAGLSGDAMSRHGPLVEIHDVSGPAPGDLAALFGFLGVPAGHRAGAEEAITEAALAQLARLFGPEAARPVKTAYQDWAQAPETASPLDHAPLSHHPAYGMPPALHGMWDGRLHLCVTEVAPEMGGFLEGALAAAEHTARLLAKERV